MIRTNNEHGARTAEVYPMGDRVAVRVTVDDAQGFRAVEIAIDPRDAFELAGMVSAAATAAYYTRRNRVRTT